MDFNLRIQNRRQTSTKVLQRANSYRICRKSCMNFSCNSLFHDRIAMVWDVWIIQLRSHYSSWNGFHFLMLHTDWMLKLYQLLCGPLKSSLCRWLHHRLQELFSWAGKTLLIELIQPFMFETFCNKWELLMSELVPWSIQWVFRSVGFCRSIHPRRLWHIQGMIFSLFELTFSSSQISECFWVPW